MSKSSGVDESQRRAAPAPDKKTTFCYGVTNTEWISIKVLYFVMSCGSAAVLPFMVPFYTWLGLTVYQIGIIEFLNLIISMVLCPLIGATADKSKRHSLVLGICMIGYLIPTAALAFFSSPDPEQYSVTLDFRETNNFQLKMCAPDIAAERLANQSSLFLSPEASEKARNHMVPQIICKNWNVSSLRATLVPTVSVGTNCSVFSLQFQNQTESITSLLHEDKFLNCTVKFPVEADFSVFAWMCFLRTLSAIGKVSTFSLCDSVCYGMLGKENRGLWGQQRMFSTMGIGLSAGITGLVVNYFQSYRLCFVVFGILTFASSLITFIWLPKRLDKLETAKKEEQRLPFFQALRVVVATPIFVMISLFPIASGLLLSVNQVVWPQLIVELGGPKMFFGLKTALIAVLEIPTLFFAGAVVKRFGESVCLIF